MKELTGKEVKFVKLDLLDEAGLKKLFAEHDFGAVIHFAGLKVSVNRDSRIIFNASFFSTPRSTRRYKCVWVGCVRTRVGHNDGENAQKECVF